MLRFLFFCWHNYWEKRQKEEDVKRKKWGKREEESRREREIKLGHPGPSLSDNWLQSLWGLRIPVCCIGQTHTHTHTLRSTRAAFLRPHEEAAVSVLPNSSFLSPSLSLYFHPLYPSIFPPLPASIPSLLRNYNYEVNYVSFLHLVFSSS